MAGRVRMSDDFDWSGPDLKMIPTQPETAIYFNPHGQLVIRQREWPDDDSCVRFNRESVPALLTAIMTAMNEDEGA